MAKSCGVGITVLVPVVIFVVYNLNVSAALAFVGIVMTLITSWLAYGKWAYRIVAVSMSLGIAEGALPLPAFWRRSSYDGG